MAGHRSSSRFEIRDSRPLSDKDVVEPVSFCFCDIRQRHLEQFGAIRNDGPLLLSGNIEAILLRFSKVRDRNCLLYTSDAADEGLGVDIGGGRII